MKIPIPFALLCLVALCRGSDNAGEEIEGFSQFPIFSPVSDGTFPSSAFGIFPVGNKFYQAFHSNQKAPYALHPANVPERVESPVPRLSKEPVPLPIGFQPVGYLKPEVPSRIDSNLRLPITSSVPLAVGFKPVDFKERAVPEADDSTLRLQDIASVPLPIGFQPVGYLKPAGPHKIDSTVREPHTASVPLPVRFNPVDLKHPIVPLPVGFQPLGYLKPAGAALPAVL